MANWLNMNERCEVCGAWYEREEGYFLGSFAINLVVSEFVPTAAAVVLLVITWPNPPWLFVQIAAPIAMGTFPFLFFPFSRVIWLALDWNFHSPPMDQKPAQPRPGNYTRPA